MAYEYLSDKVISVAASLIRKKKENIANRILLDYHNHLKQSEDMGSEQKETYLNNYYEAHIKLYNNIS
ncbi:MAG: hypothetical protein KAI26_02290 [Nanoarchaeota archaeon]|nr:hypothetical protein [Nanoarchaeota archaeon]